MYHIGMLCFFGLLGILVIDWSRLRYALPTVLAGTLLSGIPAAIPGLDRRYELVDTPPLATHWAIFYALQMFLVPVLVTWFVQGLPPGSRFPLKRILLFTLLLQSAELMQVSAGRIVYTSWWGPGEAALYELLFFLLLAQVYYYTSPCGSPYQRGDRSAREVKAPGVLSAPLHPDMVPGRLDH